MLLTDMKGKVRRWADAKMSKRAVAMLLAMALVAAVLPITPTSVTEAAGPWSAYSEIPAADYTSQFGTQTENSSEGGLNVGFIDNGDYLGFNPVNFGTGSATRAELRVASNASGGTIEIRLGGSNGTLIGSCAVPGTGGWQNWMTVSCAVTPTTGSQHVFLKFTGGSGNLMNVRWLKFGAGLSAFNQNAASGYSSQSGIQTENSSEGGLNVGYIDNGDYLAFNSVDFGSGANRAEFRVASATSGGAIEIRLGGVNGTLAGTCSVPGTGGWQSWTTVSCTTSLIAGVQSLYLKFTGGAGNLFNVRWLQFSTGASGGDVVGKLFAGYQGWFTAIGDGSPLNNWNHWTKNGASPATSGNVNFEMYPDMREYSKKYGTSLGNLGNGQPATLFSSYDQETVNKHFEWMQTYNIDGAALQRFGAKVNNASPDSWMVNRDSVAVKVKNAAETYNRKFYVMYDITGMDPSTWTTAVKNDFNQVILQSMALTSSSSYARQDGKPVVCIWGIGFTDRPGTAAEASELITWFKNQGYYVIGGVPTHWLTEDRDSKPNFLSVYNQLDMLSPWFVGRFDGIAGADHYKVNQWQPDYAYTQQRGIVYQPVIWPGFAWANLHGGPQNQIPRLHGDFMWRQAYNLKSLGISTGYVAMFDEYDEATAIAKAAENSSMIPNNHYFLTLDADGVAVSSDFYLRLTGDINRMFKGQIPATAQHPTSHQ